MDEVKELVNLINKRIEDYRDLNRSNVNDDPIDYILSLGGKRVRSTLVLMSYKLFDSNIEIAIKPALAVELFHNFSLVHDDLMDDALIRRGMPSVHVKWDTNTAILSGDTILIKSYQFLEALPAEVLKLVFSIFNTVAIEVCEGQRLDILFEDIEKIEMSEYIRMIKYKTAVLIAASLKIGAVLGNAKQKDIDLLYEFGINIGIAFQLQDDMLDLYATSVSFGKKIGGDILENKKTFLFIKALELANCTEREDLLFWFRKRESDDLKISSVKGIYDKLNVKHHICEEIEHYYHKAKTILSQVSVSEDKKAMLYDFSKKLMSRKF
ncbi:polyprenyl synthetase family protein [Ichthyobacterium seriolicida]|uniref:Isoprenyl synthetase n=1 Tax=Ichthyobacterium seriolicida TaxID=242600 RepID=A0A1J1E5N3_9FLAO|nr:polyprenyl synthetase family protein [Ichthyobacterium seriolicida]BAV94622.1 isoprenyl synthetase [Ichthyobacterium seriolicida]